MLPPRASSFTRVLALSVSRLWSLNMTTAGDAPLASSSPLATGKEETDVGGTGVPRTFSPSPLTTVAIGVAAIKTVTTTATKGTIRELSMVSKVYT